MPQFYPRLNFNKLKFNFYLVLTLQDKTKEKPDKEACVPMRSYPILLVLFVVKKQESWGGLASHEVRARPPPPLINRKFPSQIGTPINEGGGNAVRGSPACGSRGQGGRQLFKKKKSLGEHARTQCVLLSLFFLSLVLSFFWFFQRALALANCVALASAQRSWLASARREFIVTFFFLFRPG